MHCVGLVSTYDGTQYRAAILKKEGQGIGVELLQSFPCSIDSVKLFYNLPPFHTAKGVRLVSGLSGTDVLVRTLHLPVKERKKLLATLPFQLESLLPYSLDDAVICPMIHSIHQQMSVVTVFATTEAILSNHLASLKDLNLNVDVVSCAPVALARFAHWHFPEESQVLALHVEGGMLLCVVAAQKELLLSQTIPMDGEAVFEKLAIYLKQKGVDADGVPWLLTGDGGCEDACYRAFGKNRLVLKDPSQLEYAISIGLALDALVKDGFSLQLCQEKFLPHHVRKKRKHLARLYLGVCLASTLFLGISSKWVCGQKKEVLLSSLNQSLPQPLSSSASYVEIAQALHQWEASLNRQSEHFPFLPTVPLLSDVLAWISTHPAFSLEDGEKKEGIELKGLHYQLIKYPKIAQSQLPYRAVLSLEFATDVPRLARDLHEALLKGDPLVDPKKEIVWQVQDQNYYTSFELKHVTH